MLPAASDRAAPAVGSAPPVDEVRPAVYRVIAKFWETKATATLSLVPTDTVLPVAGPGQFNMLWVWGQGEVPISTSEVGTPDLIKHTIRDVGGVTRALCAAQPGELVGVRGPFGLGWDLEAAKGKDVVIVAGGIGLAPLRPVVRAILTDREAFGRVDLVVGARSEAELIFRAELDGWWKDRRIGVRTIVDHSSERWHGNVGIVTKELDRVELAPEQTVAYVCGPEIMIRFVGIGLQDRGLDQDRIFVSLERNMQCGVGHCGHCQMAGLFVCRDGPVVPWRVARPLMEVREL